jgi:hypothetical protein
MRLLARHSSGLSRPLPIGLWFVAVSLLLADALLRWGLHASTPPQMFPGSDQSDARVAA